MKALTVWQPWATLLAVGAKQFETRDWSTDYRGRLAIHAATRWDEDLLSTCQKQPFRKVLRDIGYDRVSELPRGKVLAIGTIDRIWKTDRLPPQYLTDREEAFGNFAPGRNAWKIDIERRLDPPVEASGRPGLWNWYPDGEHVAP